MYRPPRYWIRYQQAQVSYLWSKILDAGNEWELQRLQGEHELVVIHGSGQHQRTNGAQGVDPDLPVVGRLGQRVPDFGQLILKGAAEDLSHGANFFSSKAAFVAQR